MPNFKSFKWGLVDCCNMTSAEFKAMIKKKIYRLQFETATKECFDELYFEIESDIDNYFQD